ncbi:MAG TPA: response regulator [Clostridia bacterium]|nr:response regulator [Clostridia bacterium]
MSATPVVYFIDDSATMREVIKIAFRRESMNVIACHDAASALALMEQSAPDVVISDVIMPDKDGYEVCQHIKQHVRFGRTPVILMSGVVNRQVAERAFAVKADELIRKPFQPQDLITRVRHLLNPKATAPLPAAAASASVAALSSIFSAQVNGRPPQSAARPPIAMAATAGSARPVPASPLVSRPAPSAIAATAAAIMGSNPAAAPAPVASVVAAVLAPAQPRVPQPPPSTLNMDATKMRLELMRLQSQIKKLESELEAEREYSQALEEHIKTLQESD